jgi:hypothetical protein
MHTMGVEVVRSMAISARPSAGHEPARSHVGGHDLVRAWICALVLVALLGTMPLIGELAEDLSFGVEVLLLAAFTLVVILLGAGAVRYGRRARKEGRTSGLIPATIGGFLAGFFVLIQLAALVAHLVGFE